MVLEGAHELRNIDGSELQTNQKKMKIRRGDYWAELRVLYNDRDGHYYDIVGGEKHKDPHIHMGFSLLGNLIFGDDRGIITTMTKETQSQLYGTYPKEKLVLDTKPDKFKIIFRVKLVGPSKRSFVDIFALEPVC